MTEAEERPARVMPAVLAFVALALLSVSCMPNRPIDIGDLADQLAAIRPTAVIHTGDAVIASGDINGDSDGHFVMCLGLSQLATSGRECRLSVSLVNLKPSEVPGWVEEAGTRIASDVTVHGHWGADGIVVEHASPGIVGQEDVPYPANPCPHLAGLDADQRTVEVEGAARKLWEAVTGAPGVYGGVWNAGSQGQSVAVVATVGDPLEARSKLKPLYDFPVCFVHVARSAADLQRLASSVQALDPSWTTIVEAPVNRLRVVLPVVDVATWSELEVFADQIVASPLVRPK